MQNPDPNEVLIRTLADGRLSRTETQALRETTGDLSDDRLAYWRNRAFKLAGGRPPERQDETLAWLEDVVKALQPRIEQDARESVYFSPGEECRRQLVALLRGALETIDLCVFTITDNEVSREIHTAHKRRVAVRIVTDNDKAWDKGSDVDRLRDAGVPVRIDQTDAHMHHKFGIFDGRTLVNGSYNWTRSAATRNQENIVRCESPALIRAFQGEFEKLWTKFA